MNHLDLFSGIGGFSLGLQQAGIEPDWIGYSDIDRYANQVFKRRFPNAKELGSITDIQPEGLPDIDLITFGFPCQDLSVAGKRGGLQANRSGLFFKAIEIVDAKKPKYFIFENVKGLLSSNKGEDFKIVLQSVSDIGYDGQWQLLNTRWFPTTPQNRERIFFIGHIRGECRPKVFPIGESIIQAEHIQGQYTNTLKARYNAIGDGSYIIESKLNAQEKGLKRLDDVNLIAKKRKHDTPKEINTYLKKYKDRTITEIAKELDLPKTQVEHYFRDDKYRAIPSPDIWLQLKDLLGFDDTYDKQVTEIYEKEYEFESAKRVYDASGIAQTIDTGKTGLYQINIIGNLKGKGGHECHNVHSPNGIAPTVRENHGKITMVKALTETRTDEAKKIRKENMKNGKDYSPRRMKELVKRKDNVSNTITSGQSKEQYVEVKSNIRRLTPNECSRLQGFSWQNEDGTWDDSWNDIGISDTQRYKQLGNAVSIPVVKAIMEKLYAKEEKEEKVKTKHSHPTPG